MKPARRRPFVIGLVTLAVLILLAVLVGVTAAAHSSANRSHAPSPDSYINWSSGSCLVC